MALVVGVATALSGCGQADVNQDDVVASQSALCTFTGLPLTDACIDPVGDVCLEPAGAWVSFYTGLNCTGTEYASGGSATGTYNTYDGEGCLGAIPTSNVIAFSYRFAGAGGACTSGYQGSIGRPPRVWRY